MLFIGELLLFIGGVASILCRARFICFLDSLFFLDFCCVCFLFTLCLNCLCQYVTKMGRNRWNSENVFNCFYLAGDGIVFKRGRKEICDVSNLGVELVCFSLLMVSYLLSLWFILFIFFYFHTCIDVLFWVFQERHVHSDQDLLPLLATIALEV